VSEPSPRATTPRAARFQVIVRDRAISVELSESAEGMRARVDGGDERRVVWTRPSADELVTLLLGGKAVSALVTGRDGEYDLCIDGYPLHAVVQDERAAKLAQASAARRPTQSDLSVKAPMPGLVVAVNVEPGQEVARGESLVVLQAMKMENELTARQGGRVKEVLVTPGQTVDQDQTLVTLK
jgi:propionyl-CoA carboxylase alpha chain